MTGTKKAKGEFWELYKRPEWQRKRLVVMERAGFRCEECGDAETTLNVHHTYYEKGHSPWEYPDESLRCLCEYCHEAMTELTLAARKLLGAMGRTAMTQAIGYLTGIVAEENREQTYRVYDIIGVTGLADFYGLKESEVESAITPGGFVTGDGLDFVKALRE